MKGVWGEVRGQNPEARREKNSVWRCALISGCVNAWVGIKRNQILKIKMQNFGAASRAVLISDFSARELALKTREL